MIQPGTSPPKICKKFAKPSKRRTRGRGRRGKAQDAGGQEVDAGLPDRDDERRVRDLPAGSENAHFAANSKSIVHFENV